MGRCMGPSGEDHVIMMTSTVSEHEATLIMHALDPIALGQFEMSV